ncbi:MAG: hypothetical protein ACK4KT_02730 [Thermaurantimonas sp.]
MARDSVRHSGFESDTSRASRPETPPEKVDAKSSELPSENISKKSFFSIKKEHSEALASIPVEPENLPNDPFDLDKILVSWNKMTEIIEASGNSVQSALLKKWKPNAVQQNRVLVKVPSMIVEHRIRESIEPLLAEQKKQLNNYTLEFVFEVEEEKEEDNDERKIPPHVKNFNKLVTSYPEVEKLKKLFGLYPTEF